MGKVIVPNENGDSRWDFIPNPYVPALDVVVVDYFIAQSLCSRAETRPDVLVSIWDKDADATERHEWLREMEAAEECLVMVLEFDDVPVDKHGYIAATEDDVGRLTALAHGLRLCEKQKVLVHCFPPGTRIEGSEDKNIEEIVVGDVVYSSDGKLHKVTGTMVTECKTDLITLKTRGNTVLRVTPEHPIRVLRCRKDAKGLPMKPVGQRAADPNYEPGLLWVEAKDVLRGDMLVRPSRQRHAEPAPVWIGQSSHGNATQLRQFVPSTDLAWFFGLYIANGSSLGQGGIGLVLSPKVDCTRVTSVLSSFSVTPAVTDYGKYKRVSASSTALAASFRFWFGAEAKDKHIPSFLLSSEWDQQALIEGLMAGDGSYSEARKSYTYMSVSYRLVRQIYALLADFGAYPCLRPYKRKSGYANASPAWSVEYRSSGQHYTMWWRDLYCSVVQEIQREPYAGKVHNFEVEETNDYIADGVVVHNCAAGISRSSASALTLFAGILGEGQEEVAVTALQEAIAITAQRGWRSVGIKPNSGVVAHADALLERKGKLAAACAKVFTRKTADR